MNLTALLNPNHVAVNVSAPNKEALIDILIDLVADCPQVKDVAAVKKAVMDRENMMSTGVGKGLALPHAKTNAVGGMVGALVTTSTPVDFGALDNEPVRIVFLLLGKLDSKSLHVRILSRVSRVMNSEEVRKQILSSTSAAELLGIIAQYDDHSINS
ncbi:MAG: PTS sugar transporter subunit IIA [Bacteroidetes bacterium]|nr:PTS sugar transporter subunit IIA [Bacteroidota bacterium]